MAKVRSSRVRLEHDVNQMHNRIQLLELEEKRALKRIEETRQQADKILSHRAEHMEYQKELAAVRERELKHRQSKVNKNNDVSVEQMSQFSGSLMSGSVMKARLKIQESIQ